jgi:P4 family phage/plasmid primase-like protien
MATINEAYAAHKISAFLRDHAVAKGDEHSLTGMGKVKGCFFITDADYPKFLDLLHDYLFKGRNIPNGLVEQRGANKAYPNLHDLDFKYAPDKSPIRMFSDKNIYEYVKGYSQGLLKFYKTFPNGQHVRFFVCLRPQPYRNKRTSEGETFKELKDGIHIESPDLVMSAERQRVLRLWTLEHKILEKAFEGTEYINSPDDIFDESLVKRNGWLLYGESKPPTSGTEFLPYALHKVYVLDTLTGDIDEQAPTDYTSRILMELLSIRYNLREEMCVEHENTDESVVAEYSTLLAKSAQPKTPIVKAAAAAAAAAPEPLELEQAVANYLYPPQSERNMAVLRRLVLECLSPERADKYATWRETEWCLRNINDSEEMFRLWIEFSKKSSKANGINVEHEFRDWKRGAAMNASSKKLTKRSLYYWAREDNPQKYNEIIKADLVEWISQGRCKNTHNHIAQLMNLLYDGDYRVAMDSKNTLWYHYDKNMWQTIVQGIDLRNKLSTEIVDIVTEGRKERRQWLSQQGNDEPGNDLIFKELLAIEKNLYSCNFKSSVMQEAANTFYERDFQKKLNATTTTLGCANCIIDLRATRQCADGSGGTEEYVQIRDPKPEDYISFMAGNNPPDMEPLEYYPISDADKGRLANDNRYDTDIKWDDPSIGGILDFFKKLFPRPDLREYTLTLMASCLEAANREQAYYFMTGIGSNGKSKLVELMRYVLGDYLTSLSTTAITRKRPDSGAANPDIIKIKNKRMIIMQEPDPNEPLNTSRMKQFSGEDDVEARGLFQDQETFKITGKLFMSCNKLPPVHTMDNGTWRRIRVLSFESMFVDSGDTRYDPSKNIFYKDYTLDAKLKSWRQSFLSLLLHYYETRYLKTGLNPPPIVMQVSNQYKYSHDSFAKFFESCVRKDPEAPDVNLTKVFKSYNAWYSNLAGSSGSKLKADEFKTRLEEKLNTTITKNVRGIKVFGSEEEAEDFDKESVGSGSVTP